MRGSDESSSAARTVVRTELVHGTLPRHGECTVKAAAVAATNTIKDGIFGLMRGSVR
jgi:hypothetical protein